MTMEEAERFFKAYGGSSFHMDREDPAGAQLYRRTNVPEETEERWREELAEERKRREPLPAEEYDRIVEKLLEEPYHVIDILPAQVPAGSRGQYFAVEEYLSERPQRESLYRKFADILLGLNCYYDLAVTDGFLWTKNMQPQELAVKTVNCFGREFLNILLEGEDVLITLYGGDLYMTVYGASGEVLERTKLLAAARGLFVREGSGDK